jgi:hypothetical protein
MREYELYLPTQPGEIEKIKGELVDAFGGYTEVTQRCEGVWKIGGVAFRDEISIIRVLDDGAADFDMRAYRRDLEERLEQEHVLITVREVATV